MRGGGRWDIVRVIQNKCVRTLGASSWCTRAGIAHNLAQMGRAIEPPGTRSGRIANRIPLKEYTAMEERCSFASYRGQRDREERMPFSGSKRPRAGRWNVQIRISIKNRFPLCLFSMPKTKHLSDSLCDASLHCWLSASGCCVVKRRLVPLLSVSFRLNGTTGHVSSCRAGPGRSGVGERAVGSTSCSLHRN